MVTVYCCWYALPPLAEQGWEGFGGSAPRGCCCWYKNQRSSLRGKCKHGKLFVVSAAWCNLYTLVMMLPEFVW